MSNDPFKKNLNTNVRGKVSTCSTENEIIMINTLISPVQIKTILCFFSKVNTLFPFVHITFYLE